MVHLNHGLKSVVRVEQLNTMVVGVNHQKRTLAVYQKTTRPLELQLAIASLPNSLYVHCVVQNKHTVLPNVSNEYLATVMCNRPAFGLHPLLLLNDIHKLNPLDHLVFGSVNVDDISHPRLGKSSLHRARIDTNCKQMPLIILSQAKTAAA